MKLKNLTILLHEGLANRIRVMASLYHLTQKSINIKVIWQLNSELNCPFEKLFTPINGFQIINTSKRTKLYNTKQKNILKRTIAKIYDKSKGFDYVIIGGYNNPDSCNAELIHSIFNNYRNVFIETQQIIFYNQEYSIFKPIKEIEDRIIHSFSLSQPYIGIHIRRGDNIQSQLKSGIIPFIEKTKTILKDNPMQKFYLATDSRDVKDIFKYLFGPSIITSDPDYSRNNEIGIKDALFEMFMLSKSQKIYGSYWSSFAENAASIGNISIETIVNQQ